jgi:hypothetical protein
LNDKARQGRRGSRKAAEDDALGDDLAGRLRKVRRGRGTCQLMCDLMYGLRDRTRPTSENDHNGNSSPSQTARDAHLFIFLLRIRMTDPLHLRRVTPSERLILPEPKDGRLEVLADHGDPLKQIVGGRFALRPRTEPGPDGESVKGWTSGEDDAGDEVGGGLVRFGSVGRVNGGERSLKGFADGGEHL